MTAAAARFVAALCALVALVAIATVDRPVAHAGRPPQPGVAPVSTVTRVCPSVTGGASQLATDMTIAAVGTGQVSASYAPLTGRPALHRTTVAVAPSHVLHSTSPGGAVVVTATGSGAAGVVASQVALAATGRGRGLSDTPCASPATDWWFAGADGRIGITDRIYVVNPADTPANVALSLWASRGPLSPPGVSGITVPAHGVVVRAVSDLAPDAQWVAVHVHANSGTVTAALVDEHLNGVTPGGADWIPATAPPATSGVVTGFTNYSHVDVVHLANPGTRDATVALRVVTTSRNFVPAGSETIVVPAGHTVAVNLTAAIAGELAAVSFSSDSDVVASGIAVTHPTRGLDDIAWLPAQQPLTAAAAIAADEPPFGQSVRLVLTAPAGRAAVVIRSPRGSTHRIAVPAGRTAAVDLRSALRGPTAGAGPVEIEPEPGAPVYVVRLLYASGAHGPLFTAEAPTVLPTATPLPAVVPDLRAASR